MRRTVILMLAREHIRNRFLRALPEQAWERLKSSLHRVALLNRQPIAHAGGSVQYVYFVDQGFISLARTMHDGRSVEVGGVGVEGLTTPTAILGGYDSAVLEAMVQVPGSAFRIDRVLLKHAMEHEAVLRWMVEDYARFQLHQVAQIAACNCLHVIEERLCRRLLTAHDNARASQFPLTHEFLAMMLGAHRPGISTAAKALQSKGLIAYSRGLVSIKDRTGLEAKACECYAGARAGIEALYSTSDYWDRRATAP